MRGLTANKQEEYIKEWESNGGVARGRETVRAPKNGLKNGGAKL